jgi:hypothetical protein
MFPFDSLSVVCYFSFEFILVSIDDIYSALKLFLLGAHVLYIFLLAARQLLLTDRWLVLAGAYVVLEFYQLFQPLESNLWYQL